MTVEQPPYESDVGLPVTEKQVNALFFCSVSQTFVAVMGRANDWCELSVFTRRANDTKYVQIELPTPQLGVLGVVVSDTTPYAYLLMHHVPSDSDPTFAIEDPLYRVQLPQGSLEKLPSLRPKGVLLRQIISYSEAPQLLNVILCVPSIAHTDSEPDYDFHRATYDPSTGKTVVLELMSAYTV